MNVEELSRDSDVTVVERDGTATGSKKAKNGTVQKTAKHFPEGFVQEDNGSYSAMRLMSFVALITAIIFGSLTLASDSENSIGTNLTYSFLVAAFTPKAVQKFAEK